MRIYSMTATFGKLSHDTLYLEPGLNIIDAPNEWGKSTWCAFLVAMLYGIDTRQQTTKAALADKERYAPWSGEPMSGRMELNWNGRDITIERSSKGRIPFGEFRAYETATGLEVPELTAANCGQQLLGVERPVFTRAGFIRLTDMPVTQDDALRRRLNNLVTTGDESGAGEQLSKHLKELKNKCRYNRSGLLPQAEYEREQLRQQLQQREDLQAQTAQLQHRQSVLQSQLRELENHAAALRYDAAKQALTQVQEAKDTAHRMEAELSSLQADCADLPDFAEAEQALRTGQQLLTDHRQLLSHQQTLPPPPVKPEPAAPYRDMTPGQAVELATEDWEAYRKLSKKKGLSGAIVLFSLCTVLAVLLLVIGMLSVPLIGYIGSPIFALVGILILIAGISGAKKKRKQLQAVVDRHPGLSPESWVSDAQAYAEKVLQYDRDAEKYRLSCGAQSAQLTELEAAIADFTGNRELSQTLSHWEEIVQKHRLLQEKTRQYQFAREHAAALQAVVTTAPEPAQPDSLTLTPEETDAALERAQFELRQLQLQQGQCLGQAEALGQEEVLRSRLDSVSRRINRLEEHYKALELAQEALHQATTALQRRFAPRISKQAQQYFSLLTDGRYQRITLSDDLSLSASAENEDTLRGAQWRSDGTVDQLYLALRLAVAEELTPLAPLVLDDALVRFDDCRLKSALTVLQQQAEHKQVLLFSCQSRESNLLDQP